MREKESKYEADSLKKIATNIMFTQMSEKSGVEKFGEKAVTAMIK